MRPLRARTASYRLSRRAFLRHGLRGAGAVALALGGPPVLRARASGGGADAFGPLQPPDANGLMLPPGFASRVLATSGQAVLGTAHTWHQAPDGGATFPTTDGGWVYVSNAEVGGSGGGVGALRFDPAGDVVDAYSILSGTAQNCAGGPTPWATWLSCEEWPGGRVFECDPYAPGSQGVVRPALGTFMHEAAAVDALHEQVYLTEDRPDGLLYRFTSSAGLPNLGAGALDAAQVLDPLGQGPIQPGQVRPLAWHAVPNPTPPGGGVQDPTYLPLEGRATRYQVPLATPLNGGEGMWFESGLVYFATKGDSRVYVLDTTAQTLEILYDYATSSDPELRHVDNVYTSLLGDVYVAEDPGNLQIVALTAGGNVVPALQLTGVVGTEITGPALSPDGRHLYWSSQRNPGRTYEVTGPFAAAQAVPLFGAAGRALLAAAICVSAALALRERGRATREA